jgi:hypothetical protein
LFFNATGGSILIQAAAEASEGAKKLYESPQEFEPKVLFSEVERAFFPPLRWFVRRSFAKVREGDLAAPARNLLKLAQVQGLLVVAMAVIMLTAGYILLSQLGTPS